MKALLFCLFSVSFVQSLIFPFRPQKYLLNTDPSSKKYPLSRDYYEKFIENSKTRLGIQRSLLRKNIKQFN